MTKYVLISKDFSGNITFYFNELGLLVEFQVNSWDIAADSLERFHRVLPNLGRDTLFLDFCAHYKYRIRKDEVDLSFERWYDFYGLKKDGHIAERKWKTIKRHWWQVLINTRCYKGYYNRNKGKGYTQLHPKAYLNGEHWRDDWDKLDDWR